jgi:hypothetical protein
MMISLFKWRSHFKETGDLSFASRRETEYTTAPMDLRHLFLLNLKTMLNSYNDII